MTLPGLVVSVLIAQLAWLGSALAHDPRANANTAGFLRPSNPQRGLQRHLTTSNHAHNPPTGVDKFRVLKGNSILMTALESEVESYGPPPTSSDTSSGHGPGGLALLLASGVLSGGVAGGRRLSSNYPDPRVFYFNHVDHTGTYEIYSGYNSSIFNQLHITVDKCLGAAIKGELTARKYGHDGMITDVPVKFDLTIGCDSKNRFKYKGEDSYITSNNVALAISNVNKSGQKCAIDRQNLQGTIWVGGYDIVAIIKRLNSFHARTKQVASETQTLYRF